MELPCAGPDLGDTFALGNQHGSNGGCPFDVTEQSVGGVGNSQRDKMLRLTRERASGPQQGGFKIMSEEMSVGLCGFHVMDRWINRT
jgi:hypothetical protein